MPGLKFIHQVKGTYGGSEAVSGLVVCEATVA